MYPCPPGNNSWSRYLVSSGKLWEIRPESWVKAILARSVRFVLSSVFVSKRFLLLSLLSFLLSEVAERAFQKIFTHVLRDYKNTEIIEFLFSPPPDMYLSSQRCILKYFFRKN